MYQYDQRPATTVKFGGGATSDTLRTAEYAVLVGRNNCGKSFLLKTLAEQWGEKASYLGPARYQNFNLLGYYTPTRNRRRDKYRQFLSHWQNQQQNIDNSPLNLQQAIAELSDTQRDSFKEIVKSLLSVDLEIRNTVDGNEMSQKYISCNGHNISYTSSGFRLIMTLVVGLLDEDYDTFLIDEPELGISPEAQGILADFLFDRDARKKYFSHIRTLVLATHSTIFLDRQHIANNYVVSKSGDEISVEGTSSQSEFNRIHFFLLGNRFETLYLPSAIMLVEGKCDHRFVERALTLKFPKAQFSVVQANSDDRIKELLNMAKGLFSDLQTSPYRDRIFAVLDSVHQPSLPAQLVQMGLPATNIVEWSNNGIEYVYPDSVMDTVYGAGGQMTIAGDLVERNGRQYTKSQLCEKVVALLSPTTVFHPEFEAKILKRIEPLVA